MSRETSNVELEIYYRRRGYRKRIFYLERYISILTSIISGDIQISGLSRPTIDVDISSKGIEYDTLRLILFPGYRVWKLYFISGGRFPNLIACGVIGDYKKFEETLKNISDQFFRVF